MPANGTYTLLELVQIVLSALDSDEVNSINDTIESTQVALLLKVLYHEFIVEHDIEEKQSLIELNASGSVNRPVLMTVPTDVNHISSIKYNCKADGDTHSDYRPIQYVPLQEYLLQYTRADEDSTDWESMSFTVGSETFEVSYRNDKHPQFYTDIGGHTLLFDSYNSEVDSTLQKSKTMCIGSRSTAWEETDGFIPPLRAQHFPLFINRAKGRAFVEIKQMTHDEAKTSARRLAILEKSRNERLSRDSALSRTSRYGRK